MIVNDVVAVDSNGEDIQMVVVALKAMMNAVAPATSTKGASVQGMRCWMGPVRAAFAARPPISHRSGSQVKTQSLLELVHSDVMGPMIPKSKGGSRYVVTIIDDFSRYVSVYLLKAKSKVLKCFEEYRQFDADGCNAEMPAH
ncbi:unnamed protein product [Phytophthora lilii]|uniref:Unnamed protein product n=1 Tax=Phytophthora lilii TaxID=2077276 RepID=A0A9W6X233_9STRA|nr:unnamed protein product [Phytophthora lilii]